MRDLRQCRIALACNLLPVPTAPAQGCRVDAESGAIVAPLHLATTFERGPGLEFPKGYIYSRIDNPSRALFELTMARLDRGVAAAAFSSGENPAADARVRERECELHA